MHFKQTNHADFRIHKIIFADITRSEHSSTKKLYAVIEESRDPGKALQ